MVNIPYMDGMGNNISPRFPWNKGSVPISIPHPTFDLKWAHDAHAQSPFFCGQETFWHILPICGQCSITSAGSRSRFFHQKTTDIKCNCQLRMAFWHVGGMNLLHKSEVKIVFLGTTCKQIREVESTLTLTLTYLFAVVHACILAISLTQDPTPKSQETKTKPSIRVTPWPSPHHYNTPFLEPGFNMTSLHFSSVFFSPGFFLHSRNSCIRPSTWASGIWVQHCHCQCP